MLKLLATTSRRVVLVTLTLVAVVVVGGVAIGWKITRGSGSDIIVVADYFVNGHDKRQVGGLSDNVFVGQVIEQTGVIKDESGSVYTLFSVRIEQNIKGELSGVVVVRQPGGYDEDYAAMQVVNGDSLLRPGPSYVLATNASTDLSFHTMFAGFGWASLDGPRDRASVIGEYEEAFKNQIVDPRHSAVD